MNKKLITNAASGKSEIVRLIKTYKSGALKGMCRIQLADGMKVSVQPELLFDIK